MEYTWSQNKTIEINENAYSVVSGESMIVISEYSRRTGQDNLFEYAFIGRICDTDIADNVGYTKLFMLVPADSSSSFSYTDQEILETSAYISIFAAPDSEPHHSIEEGEIRGRKIDENSWQVSIDIVTNPQVFEGYYGSRSITTVSYTHLTLPTTPYV